MRAAGDGLRLIGPWLEIVLRLGSREQTAGRRQLTADRSQAGPQRPAL
jgi:hypothetical protein